METSEERAADGVIAERTGQIEWTPEGELNKVIKTIIFSRRDGE